MNARGEKSVQSKPSRLEVEKRVKYGELFKTVVELGTCVHRYPPSQTTLYDLEIYAQATIIPTDDGFHLDRQTHEGLSNVYDVTIDTMPSSRGADPSRITGVNLTAQLVYIPPSTDNYAHPGFHAKRQPPQLSEPFNIKWLPLEQPTTIPEVTPPGLEPGFPPEGIDVIRTDFDAVLPYLVQQDPKRFY